MQNNNSTTIEPSLEALSPNLFSYSERAVVLELEKSGAHRCTNDLTAQRPFWLLEDQLRQTMPAGVQNLVLGNQNLTAIFDPLRISFNHVCNWMESAWQQLVESEPNQHSRQLNKHQIKAHFGGSDGADLEVIAKSLSKDPQLIIEDFCASIYTVLFVGFLPGFPYLGGLPTSLSHARRAPRQKVPAGSIAIGGTQAGIYPVESPGGWQIIGRIEDQHLPLYDPSRAPSLRFLPGDQIEFIVVK